MGKAIDFTGRRFGRLVALRVIRRHGERRMWECLCDCGATTITSPKRLACGETRSCGCLFRDTITLHGATHHPLYPTWNYMLTRCYNTKSEGYEHYGGRGIKICDRWLNNPHAFFEDMGPKPSPKHSIDRIDSEGDYEPSNCRWATSIEQNRNRSVCKKLTWNGRTMGVPEWAEEIGIPRRRLTARLRDGWTLERALTQPKRKAPRRNSMS